MLAGADLFQEGDLHVLSNLVLALEDARDPDPGVAIGDQLRLELGIAWGQRHAVARLVRSPALDPSDVALQGKIGTLQDLSLAARLRKVAAPSLVSPDVHPLAAWPAMTFHVGRGGTFGCAGVDGWRAGLKAEITIGWIHEQRVSIRQTVK
jgi:hypothetical protein